jgi:CRISPR-associated RAMP protein (TIGR02581 family)
MSELVADFHCLRERLRLTGTLTTRTALRVGSSAGGDFDTADLPVLKDADGRPYLPGGSIKGALRSTIEALVRGAHTPAREDAHLWACDPLAREDADAIRKACGHHVGGRRDQIDTQQHCAVCRLFGSHVVASHVRFCDALLDEPRATGTGRRPPVELRDGVAIDRDLGTVHGSQKYDFEVVSPGTRFAVEVFVDNPQDWLLGLLVMGFDQLSEGFTALGGFTSRGLGRVDLAWSSLTRTSAEALLAGEAPSPQGGDALAAEMRAWRAALAARAGLTQAPAPTPPAAREGSR